MLQLTALLALTSLVHPALAARADHPPRGAPRASLLLCSASDCEQDAAWVEGLGIVDDEALVLVDLLMELDAGGWAAGIDQRGRFEEGLEAATQAAAEGRWRAVEAACERALEALEAWPGTVPPQVLFDLHWLRGAAQLHRGEDKGHELSFRQAAAMLDGAAPLYPLEDEGAQRTFVEEWRKLKVAGEGELLLGLVPPHTQVWVNGRPLEDEQIELSLAPAEHRITAQQRGGVRSWSATVPVLGGRTSRVVIDLPASSSAAWVTEELGQLFFTLQAPPELEEMLRELCLRFELGQLRLLLVEHSRDRVASGLVELGPPDRLRPEAAEGEVVDHGDGVPSSYEDQLESEHHFRQERSSGSSERRLRVVFYDPVTGHFQADGGTAGALGVGPDRMRLGASMGYARMLARHHVGAELSVALAAGPLWVDLRAGAARAEEPYRLYPDWSDRWLYHLALGPGWRRPRGAFRPSATLLAEAWLPVSLGARLELGAALCLDRGLCAGLMGFGGASDRGASLGAGLRIEQGL